MFGMVWCMCLWAGGWVWPEGLPVRSREPTKLAQACWAQKPQERCVWDDLVPCGWVGKLVGGVGWVGSRDLNKWRRPAGRRSPRTGVSCACVKDNRCCHVAPVTCFVIGTGSHDSMGIGRTVKFVLATRAFGFTCSLWVYRFPCIAVANCNISWCLVCCAVL